MITSRPPGRWLNTSTVEVGPAARGAGWLTGRHASRGGGERTRRWPDGIVIRPSRVPTGCRRWLGVIMPPVTTAAPTISARIHSLNRPNLVSIGTIVWLSSELMFFAGLFGMYFTTRANTDGEWPPPPTELDVPYALIVKIGRAHV